VWDPSSPTGDQTPTSCPERQSLNPWTTREVPEGLISLVPLVVHSLDMERHHNQRVASTHHNQKKPAFSHEASSQPKIK